MLHRTDDTIAAIASPAGGGVRGVVRIGGEGVLSALRSLLIVEDHHTWADVTVPTMFDASVGLAEGAALLPCRVYFWPNRRSFTGQPTAELHTLGSPPLLDELLVALSGLGVRLAEPGEFTLRAFLSGRVDLTQAEAVLGCIDASDSDHFDTALAQLAGGLSTPLGTLRDTLLDALAHVEASFDFAEEDLSFITEEQLDGEIRGAITQVELLCSQVESRTDGIELPRLVLTGSPNTGKSSLFNVLGKQDGALISAHPGTTRDYLTVELDLGGVKCLLVDTAGVEVLEGGVVSGPRGTAQDVTQKETDNAHLEILCLDASRPLNAWEGEQLAQDTSTRLFVLTKCDAEDATLARQKTAIRTSVVTGLGIDLLRDALRAAIFDVTGGHADVVATTAVRCRESLGLARESLNRALRVLHGGGGEELVAAELRVALDELGKVVGSVYTDDVLDRIFSRFCVGK